jgi:hypothetical protein
MLRFALVFLEGISPATLEVNCRLLDYLSPENAPNAEFSCGTLKLFPGSVLYLAHYSSAARTLNQVDRCAA